MSADVLSIVGYANRLSLRAGEELQFMVSTTSSEYKASIVRLLGGMTDPDGCDLPVELIPAACNGTYRGRLQETNVGSYAELPLPADWLTAGEFTAQMWLWCPKPALHHEQVLWSASSNNCTARVNLRLDKDGGLVFSLTDLSERTLQVCANHPVETKAWYFISAHYSAKDEVATLLISRQNGWTPRKQTNVFTATGGLDFTDVKIPSVILAAEYRDGTTGFTCNHFNGKIENPRFYRSALDPTQLHDELSNGAKPLASDEKDVVADYDFSQEISTNRVVDRSIGGHHGTLYQGPIRGVTSHAWNGEYVDFRVYPEHYSAVHFHDDDIEDSGWNVDITWQLPEVLRSGVYALKLEADHQTDYVPFFVRPSTSTASAPVLFLAPTNTYLAYANERLFEVGLDAFMSHELKLAEQDRYILAHPEIGKSAYDTHTDGSGVCYSSRLRPIMNIRPHYRNWLTGVVRHLAADLYITGWLEKRGEHYDVAADEDLDREGGTLLKNYKVLVTGTHPEYWTRPMMDALRDYLASGGRLMYLGANGFYWVTSLDRSRPHLMEVRRGNSGTRCWDSPPGELHHSTSGESGGLWRHHGYVPQQLVGIGFTSQGWGPGCGYKRLPDSFKPEAEFIFDGIREDEIIGDFGYVLGGAVGDEIDRLDFDLGTPRHTLWLATSTGLDDHYQFVHEDMLMTAPQQGGTENELVRADMIYFDIEGGGAVFSVGSINWAGSMAWNDYDNNTVRVCDNVFKHFLG